MKQAPILYFSAAQVNILSLSIFLAGALDRQVIISTHDERFYKLVSRKIDPQYFNSKFFELGTFGQIKK